MPEQFQCRFCPKSYKEVLEFLDHFETHMDQDYTEEKEKEENSSQENERIEQDQNNSNVDKTFKRKLEDEEITSCVSEKDFDSKTKIIIHIKKS